MSRRMRKFVGTLIMLVFVLVYAMVVQAVAVAVLREPNKIVEAIFYCVAGLAWAPPLMILIKWMEGGADPERPTGKV
jgi:hypothetical protein